MTKLDELKAKKKKLEAERAKLQKAAKDKKKAKKEAAAIDTTKTVAKNQKNKIPAFMQAESKY